LITIIVEKNTDRDTRLYTLINSSVCGYSVQSMSAGCSTLLRYFGSNDKGRRTAFVSPSSRHTSATGTTPKSSRAKDESAAADKGVLIPRNYKRNIGL